MASSPSSSKSPPVRPAGRRRLRRVSVLVFGLFFLAVFIWHVWLGRSPRPFEWLSAGQFKQMTTPGPLARVKFKLRDKMEYYYWHYSTSHWIQRLLHYKLANEIEINLRTKPFLAISTMQPGLGPPAYTNLDGVRCWIISNEQLRAFWQRLEKQAQADIDGPNETVPIATLEDGEPACLETLSMEAVSKFN